MYDWKHFHSNAQAIMSRRNREEMIAWLCTNDPNGCYTDEDSRLEGLEPMTTDDAYECMLNLFD